MNKSSIEFFFHRRGFLVQGVVNGKTHTYTMYLNILRSLEIIKVYYDEFRIQMYNIIDYIYVWMELLAFIVYSIDRIHGFHIPMYVHVHVQLLEY